jgi:hypothetical protein
MPSIHEAIARWDADELEEAAADAGIIIGSLWALHMSAWAASTVPAFQVCP